MSHVLSFPSYLPEPHELKASLLLHDRISTIVPLSDQDKVLERDAYTDIADAVPPGSLGFFDPSTAYVWWFDNEQVRDQLKKKYIPILREKKHKDLCEMFALDGAGYLRPSGNYVDTYNFLLNDGWRPLACQKFPPDLLNTLLELKLAARIPPIEGESEPILTHPRIGGFILSQIARHFALHNEVTPLANTDTAFKDCLFDGTLNAGEQRAILLGITINAAVPNDISAISGDDFLSLRDALASTRLELDMLLQELLINLKLDSVQDAMRFKERITDKSSDIHRRIKEAEKNIGPRNFLSKTLTFTASALGGAAGYALGGLDGALISAISPLALSKVPNNLSTRFYTKDSNAIEKFAAIRAQVIRGREQAQYKPFVPYI